MSESAPGLLPIFRSAHQLRLLGHVMIHSGSAFSIAELNRRLGIPQQTVSREVARLENAGLLVSRRIGRTRVVEANSDSPYFPELRSLMLKAVGPAPVLAEALSEVDGVEEAFIFGSWARRYSGEQGPAPVDVDVLVVGDADPDAVDAACQRAERRLGVPVNSVTLSRAEWRSDRSGFARGVREGPAVPIVGHE